MRPIITFAFRKMNLNQPINPTNLRHTRWVKSTHWIITGSFILLVFTGIEILMVHPRLYWGEAGNDLTPALLELPISRNYQHGGWENTILLTDQAGGPVSASRTYDIFNQNGWGRSLHFLAGWFLVVTGIIYLISGIFSGHIRRFLWPRSRELSPSLLWRDIVNHLRFQLPTGIVGPQYGLLQKISYIVVIFILMPLIVMTGMTMSPAITASYPFLLKIFFGAQSARTIHFFTAFALVLFLVVHIVMVVKTGFRQHIRAMTFGK